MSLVPKIKIEVNKDMLQDVCDSLSHISRHLSNQRESKAFVNALELICDKLLKKQLSKRHETKKFKLTFDFIEAHFLEMYLIIYNSAYNVYNIQLVINQLNQKLA